MEAKDRFPKLKDTEQMIEDAKRDGRKEVVDWIENQCVFRGRGAGTMEMKIMKWWWQAKLKEWFPEQ